MYENICISGSFYQMTKFEKLIILFENFKIFMGC